MAANVRYYLVCNYDKYEDLSNYRLDRISDIQLLDTPAKPIEKIRGVGVDFDIKKHLDQHIYMFSAKATNVKFKADKQMLNDVIDYFGKNVRFSDETDTDVTVSVNIAYTDMKLWAMQFATQVTVLEPKCLADECKGLLMKAVERYT